MCFSCDWRFYHFIKGKKPTFIRYDPHYTLHYKNEIFYSHSFFITILIVLKIPTVNSDA